MGKMQLAGTFHKIVTNVKALAMWRYSLFVQPEPMLNKNTKIHCLFYRSIELGHAGTKAD